MATTTTTKPKTTFLTFGGGRPGHPRRLGYHRALRRICAEAAAFDVFDDIIGYTDDDFRRAFPDFCARHGDFIETQPAYGYYLWKPFLIHHHLQAMADGDLLLYADAGCELNPGGKARLRDYLALGARYGVLTFHLPPALSVEAWTAPDTLARLDPERRWAKRAQHEAGVSVIAKNARTLALAAEWLAVCIEGDYRYLMPPSSPPPPPSFSRTPLRPSHLDAAAVQTPTGFFPARFRGKQFQMDLPLSPPRKPPHLDFAQPRREPVAGPPARANCHHARRCRQSATLARVYPRPVQSLCVAAKVGLGARGGGQVATAAGGWMSVCSLESSR